MSGVLFLTATVMLLLFSNEFLKHHIYFYFIIGILLGTNKGKVVSDKSNSEFIAFF
jgi:hypothetical protein